MKRIYFGAVLAFFSSALLAATLVPVQLVNPSGSTAGQAIISTGSGSAPAWGAVPLSGVSGTLAVANGGTGSTSASAARTSLGLGTAATQSIGTSGATVPLLNTSNTWAASQTFSVRPTFNGATPWDSTNLSFASPPAIGATTPAAGTFTTLKGANSKAIASTTNAQSLPNNVFTQITTFSAALNQGSNFTASTGSYVAPAAGTYDVRAAFTFNALAAGTVGAQIIVGVFVNGTVVQKSMPVTLQTTTSVSSGIEGMFLVNCAASDVITVSVFHNLGTALVLNGAAASNWVTIVQEP